MRLHPDPEIFDHRGAAILATRYFPTEIDTHVALFATDVLVTDQRFGPSLGWEDLHKGPMEIHHVPGSHESLLQQPHVDELADIFSRSLRAALGRWDATNILRPQGP